MGRLAGAALDEAAIGEARVGPAVEAAGQVGIREAVPEDVDVVALDIVRETGGPLRNARAGRPSPGNMGPGAGPDEALGAPGPAERRRPAAVYAWACYIVRISLAAGSWQAELLTAAVVPH